MNNVTTYSYRRNIHRVGLIETLDQPPGVIAHLYRLRWEIEPSGAR